MSLHALGHPPFRDPAAACRFVPVAVMFPSDTDGDATAKAVCAPCPARVECLDYAITNGERYGVWGGMTPTERMEEVDRRGGGSGLRTCIDCGVPKSLVEFRRSRVGPKRRCKPCENEYNRPVATAYRNRKKAEREGAA